MLSLKEIKDNIESVKKAISAKNIEFDLDKLLSDDEKRREIIQKVENLKSERNVINKKIASKEDVEKLFASLSVVVETIAIFPK